ncbi:MAG TPA: hydantoin racemase, partial [Clostridiaceae bacterium]|nr:hydantoin racemase [Clostridiaceae bacterium]
KDIIITAPAEASVHLGATLGDKFSIIVGRDKWIPQMRELVNRYGLLSKLASFRSIGLGVLDFHKNEEKTKNKIRAEIAKAIERDRAEVIILGCTMQFGFFQDLQNEFGVPVIDSMLAAMKYAEYLLEVKQKTGWHISRRAKYERPPTQEMISWGLI